MSDKLYISGVQLDLKENQPISITYSQADIKDPTKRVRSFSKTFDLAGTQNNIKFFKEFVMLTWVRNDNIVTNATFNPSVNLPCKLYKNEHLRFEGFIKLIEVNINKGVISFVVNMYSDVSNFFQQWDDMLISDLDWSMYIHPLNESHIRESWNNQVKVNGVFTSNFSGVNPLGFGYIYGLVDYGLSPNQTDYTDNQLFPLLYYREIFIKSFEYLGITIDSNFIDSQDFKDLIFGWGGGENPSLPSALISSLEVDADFDASFSNTANASIVNVPTFGSSVNSVSNYKVLNLIDSESSFSESITTDALNQLTNGLLTVGATASYRIDIQFNALISNLANTDASLAGQSFSAILYLVKNNGKINVTNFSYNGVGASNWIYNGAIEVSMTSNDEYYFQFEIIGNANISGSGTFGTLTTSFDLNNSFTFTSNCTSSEVVTNSTVYLSNYLPKMKIVDFVKSAITHFNLYMSDPTVENVIKIEPMPDFYDSNNVFDDWTRKQDVSKEIKITPLATKQHSLLDFAFKNDLDFYRKDYFNTVGKHYGNYEHNNTLSYGTGVQKYTLPYTLSPLVELDNGLFIPRIVNIENGVVKTFKGSPRLYQYGGMKSGNFNILDNGGTPIAENQYPVLSNLNSITSPTKDLCFTTPEIVYYTTSSYTTNTAYKRFHSLLINELNNIDSKMLTSYFRLNQNDLYSGFMRRVKLLDGVLYRFNLLEDYNINKDGSYKVELVKILDVKSTGSAEIPFTPLVSSVDTTNGQELLSTSKSVVVGNNKKMIIVDSDTQKEVDIDLSKLAVIDEIVIFNKSNQIVTIASIGGEKINGDPDYTLDQVNSFVKLIYTGSEYLIIS